jgi:hypothetical protein
MPKSLVNGGQQLVMTASGDSADGQPDRALYAAICPDDADPVRNEMSYSFWPQGGPKDSIETRLALAAAVVILLLGWALS